MSRGELLSEITTLKEEIVGEFECLRFSSCKNISSDDPLNYFNKVECSRRLRGRENHGWPSTFISLAGNTTQDFELIFNYAAIRFRIVI